MTKNEILIFPSIKELGAFAVEWLSARISEMPDGKFFTIALSGGTTPKQLFDYVALHGHTVNWNNVLFFWGDERCVLPNSAESNYGMAHSCLFEKTGIREEQIFRIHGEADPEEEAKRYSQVLSEKLSLEEGFPRFDLILLGLGEDGHTASIFPGNTPLFQSEHVCEAVKHPQTGQHRITITGRVINNAVHVAFLVMGSGKTEIVSKILNKERSDYPASLVCPTHGRLTWLLDRATDPSKQIQPWVHSQS
jgi:6-phosphogluconolactonase